MPERSNSAAECTAPAQTTTSDADSAIRWPPRSATTPVTRRFSMRRLSTRVPVMISRFGRLRASVSR